MMTTPEPIYSLTPNQVFVFGSNTAGWHGAGAALEAKQKYGAKQHQGSGLMGQAYGIPTKEPAPGTYFANEGRILPRARPVLRTLPLATIATSVVEFLRFAGAHPELEFLVTRIGCGKAGYSDADIRPLFLSQSVPPNVALPLTFQG